MKRSVLIGIIIVVVLIGGVGAWLVAPLFYDAEVQEALPGGATAIDRTESIESPASVEQQPNVPTTTQSTSVMKESGETTLTLVREGTFQGTDSFHQAAGTAQLVKLDGKHYVRFENDFSITNGPDLFVYFGNNGTYDADTNLGKLKGNKGSQNYEVPANIDPAQYTEVWVWCRAFSIPFGSAVIE